MVFYPNSLTTLSKLPTRYSGRFINLNVLPLSEFFTSSTENASGHTLIAKLLGDCDINECNDLSDELCPILTSIGII